MLTVCWQFDNSGGNLDLDKSKESEPGRGWTACSIQWTKTARHLGSKVGCIGLINFQPSVIIVYFQHVLYFLLLQFMLFGSYDTGVCLHLKVHKPLSMLMKKMTFQSCYWCRTTQLCQFVNWKVKTLLMDSRELHCLVPGSSRKPLKCSPSSHGPQWPA